MIRIAVIFLIAIGAFVALKLLLGNKNLSNKQFGLIYVSMIVGVALLFLGISGRLHWLFAILGAVLPFAVRMMPWVFRLLDIKRVISWMKHFQTQGMGGLGGMSGMGPTSGQKSSLNTRFLAMSLDHESGTMDGEVLEGTQKGSRLSQLDLGSLIHLLHEVQVDQDSENVLRAYLDRHHENWQEQAANGDAGRESRRDQDEGSNLSPKQAYEILGLPQGAKADEVREAHRRLMQRVHPDRGGSDYLAARINAAKTVLLDHLGGRDQGA